jgi:hypothetical protein
MSLMLPPEDPSRIGRDSRFASERSKGGAAEASTEVSRIVVPRAIVETGRSASRSIRSHLDCRCASADLPDGTQRSWKFRGQPATRVPDRPQVGTPLPDRVLGLSVARRRCPRPAGEGVGTFTLEVRVRRSEDSCTGSGPMRPRSRDLPDPASSLCLALRRWRTGEQAWRGPISSESHPAGSSGWDPPLRRRMSPRSTSRGYAEPGFAASGPGGLVRWRSSASPRMRRTATAGTSVGPIAPTRKPVSGDRRPDGTARLMQWKANGGARHAPADRCRRS